MNRESNLNVRKKTTSEKLCFAIFSDRQTQSLLFKINFSEIVGVHVSSLEMASPPQCKAVAEVLAGNKHHSMATLTHSHTHSRGSSASQPLQLRASWQLYGRHAHSARLLHTNRLTGWTSVYVDAVATSTYRACSFRRPCPLWSRKSRRTLTTNSSYMVPYKTQRFNVKRKGSIPSYFQEKGSSA